MSLSADSFKHFSRKDVTDLCHCLSSVCGQNADEARGDQTSLKLVCLTTCYHWFRSKEQPVNSKSMSEDFARLIYLVVDLIQTDEDPFILYAARKAWRVLLENETPKAKIKECLHELLECLGNKEIGTLNKTTILEMTSDLLQGDLTITVLDVIKQRFSWLVENVLKFPFQEDDSILITAFLIMWRKSAKKCQDLQLDLCWVMDYEILLQIINVISVTENHSYSRPVIHLLKTFYSYGQILCLQTSVNPIYLKLGSAVLQWALGKGISNLQEESAAGFGGTCVIVSCKSKLKTEFGNLSSLRQLAALVLSVAATIVRFSHPITGKIL
ncbi:uncharacterized protein LOC110456097 isoform X1 [Mizuhopecten yessoensis]|uniref:uncharacterized protein LOC110456097 isoform X1 n=1 Tax=Mizuhopecten yessoensis TaxID=6573 RepID=UPI000B45F4AA|nr:uncharacterized protein LOC110456097 isoform X1 [Mizuhopecten yessoensis]